MSVSVSECECECESECESVSVSVSVELCRGYDPCGKVLHQYCRSFHYILWSV